MLRSFICALLLCCTAHAFAHYVEMTVTGVPKKLIQPLTKNLSINVVSPHEDEISHDHLILLYQRSEQELLAELKQYGYFKAKVSGHVKVSPNQEVWEVTFHVDMGPPVEIKALQYTITGDGMNNPVFMDPIKKYELTKGHIFNQKNYADCKSAITDEALALGFFDVALKRHQVRIDLAENTAVIVFELSTGKEYAFGPVSFDQTGYPFDEGFLKRYITFKKGAPYRSSELQQTQSHYSQTGYFNSVVMSPTPNEKTKEVPVTIKTKTQKRALYTIGLGYGTETSARLTLGADYRYLNDTGQHFRVQSQVSKIYHEVSAAYIIPGSNPVTDYTSLNAGTNFTNIIPYSAHSILVGFDRVSKLADWQFTWSLHEMFVRYLTDAGKSGKSHYLMPQVNFLYQHRVKDRFWSNGISMNWLVNGAVENAFSDATFVKGQFTAKYAIPLTSYNRVYFRTEIGGIGTNSISQLAPTLRYYTGGIATVRGYSYKSISPKDADGKLIGGRYIMDGSVNVEQHLFGKISGIAFYDIGNSFNRFTNITLFPGAGVGVAYQSPLGPIRLYLSHPIDVPKSKWRIDFTIGTFI